MPGVDAECRVINKSRPRRAPVPGRRPSAGEEASPRAGPRTGQRSLTNLRNTTRFRHEHLSAYNGTMAPGRRLDLPAPAKGKTVVYARISSHDQKSDLDRQVARVTAWATEHGFHVDQVVTEIGSGLNGKRAKFRRLLADASVATIVVEHRDRLARFGVEYLEAALAAQGRRIVVVDPSEATHDLVRDMIEVLTSFCARLYGRRGARNRALRALAAARRGDAG